MGLNIMNAQNKNGETPIAVACEFGNFNVIQYISTTFSTKCLMHENKQGIPAYFNLVRYGHLHIMKWLYDYIGPKSSFNLLNFATDDGEKVIHTACRYGKYDMLKWILEETQWGHDVKNWGAELRDLFNGKVIEIKKPKERYKPMAKDKFYYDFYEIEEEKIDEENLEPIDSRTQDQIIMARLFGEKAS